MFNFTSYKKFVSLKDGSRVLFRFLKDGDQANLTSLFQSAPPEDNRYLTYFSTEPQHFAIFLRNLNYFEKIPLTAVELEKKSIIAAGLLSRGNGATKHIGEVHCIFVARPFQGLGLGSLLLEELIALAGKADIMCLETKIVTEQKNCIRAFRNKGFESKTLLENHFCCRDGELHDVLLMTLPLKSEKEEF
jgi:GNAT superfamily N-acetyltransferase